MPAALPVTSSPEFLAALGTDTDRAVAERFGVSPKTVNAHRTRLGIARVGQARADEVDALILSGFNNAVISRITGMTRKGVRKRRAALGGGPSASTGGRPITRVGPEGEHRREIERRSKARSETS